MSPPARASSGRKAPGAGTADRSGGAPAQVRELRAQGRKTMQRLLDAALDVFERRGYHAARVDDIVRVAKTSHGTFYLYFANKEDLFRTLIAKVSTEMAEVTSALGPIGPSPDGYLALRGWIAQFSDVYARHATVIKAWTEAATDDGEFGSLGGEVAAGFMRTIYRRVKQAPPTTGVDPLVATLALVAMVERLHYYLLISRMEVDRDTMVDTLATIAHQGLFGSGLPGPAPGG
jgi:AcrR family transcriptional regulator